MTELDEIAATLLPRARDAGLAGWPVDRLRAWVLSFMPQESPQVVDGVLESLRDQLVG
jgi:hypothetical protein